jgi:hypothetical protein
MNDLHVVALIYRVEPDPNVDYDRAKLLEHDTRRFRVTVDKHRARFEMKEHYPTVEAAREAVLPFIMEWQLEADEERSQDRFRLTYDHAEVIHRDPQMKVERAPPEGGDEDVAQPPGILVKRATYPPPPDWSPPAIEGTASETIAALTEKAHVTISPPAASLTVGATDPTVTISRPLAPTVIVAPDGHLVQLEPEKQAEIGTLIEEAEKVLAGLKEALADPAAAGLQAELDASAFASPGIGHNKPPRVLDERVFEELRDVAEEGTTGLKSEQLRLGWLRSILAALRHYGNIFTEAAAKSAGNKVGLLILALIADAMGAFEALERDAFRLAHSLRS